MAGESPIVGLNPLFESIQSIAIYSTRARLYLVGSDQVPARVPSDSFQAKTHFRVLKIDRTETNELAFVDDGVVYSDPEIKVSSCLVVVDAQEIFSRIGPTLRTPLGEANTSAYGIFGFIRLLSDYHIILIKSRRHVAMIGPHMIYKIEDTVRGVGHR